MMILDEAALSEKSENTCEKRECVPGKALILFSGQRQREERGLSSTWHKCVASYWTDAVMVLQEH